MLLMFADDTFTEFNTAKGFIQWNEKRQKIWNTYGLKLNPEKTQILTRDHRQPVAVETRYGRFPIVKSVKYLGIPITADRQMMTVSKIKDLLMKKIEKIIACTSRTRGLLNYRLRQVFVDSVYRYFVTPFVLAGLLPPEEALDMYNTITKKVVRAPHTVGKRIIEALIPSYNWCLYWKETLLQLLKETPVNKSDKIMGDLSRCLYGGSIPRIQVKSRMALPKEITTIKVSDNILSNH